MSKPPPPGHLLGPSFVPPPRARFATHPASSRGRFWPEEEGATRSCYQRDRDRIIHSTAFRRLKHKTQVFVQDEGDYYRTRLTHSLEVAQIARSLARVLGLDEDLAEALALAHDLGHPPFGHAGEAALNGCMSDFGGFDHNAQALVLVTRLEHRYADFDGLNLTWEALEGLVKHNGPLLADEADRSFLPEGIADYPWDLELSTYAGPEAQIAALSDDIAYLNHDIDDGLRAGLFETGELFEAALAGPIFKCIHDAHPNLERGRLIGEAIRRLISQMVGDVAAETQRRLAALRPPDAAAIRRHSAPIAEFSSVLRAELAKLKEFLFRRMYHHPRVHQVMANAQLALTQLFDAFMADPALLPRDWAVQCRNSDNRMTARAICDYIAGMTDRFALQEHRRIFHMEIQL
ncbi:MAG TPA: deoxyguanosinetriphosphate triphosphohydrolase [Micropepsaceae bacterium]|jgi:dGTPase|nr:deoxyguanosinetriphosphate triphosphohydrolase [Micropepsaceae bacterium]